MTRSEGDRIGCESLWRFLGRCPVALLRPNRAAICRTTGPNRPSSTPHKAKGPAVAGRACMAEGALWPWRGLSETGLAANRSGDSWGVAPSLCSAQIALRFVGRQVRIGHPAHHTKQKAQRLLGLLLCVAHPSAFGGQKLSVCAHRFKFALIDKNMQNTYYLIDLNK